MAVLDWLQQLLGGGPQPQGDIARIVDRPYSADQGYQQPEQLLPKQDQPHTVDEALDAWYGMTGIPDIQKGWQTYQEGGDPLAAFGQAASGALNAAALAFPAAKALPGFVRTVGPLLGDEIGAIGFHGSPRVDLRTISASPAARQYDNATSQFGAFFAPEEGGATRYAGETGRVYKADVPLNNPYEMSWKDFQYFQAPEKTALRESLPGEEWGPRLDQLKQEASQFRETLAAAGHDGILVRNPRTGEIQEMASFGDVRLPTRAYHYSPNEFTEFDPAKIGSSTDPGMMGRGLYFSTDPAVAEAGPHRYEVDLNIRSPLNIAHPADYRTATKSDLAGAALDLPPPTKGALAIGKQSPTLPEWQQWSQSVTDAAKARGHDAAVLDYSPTGYPHQEIAVYDPSIIEILRKYGILPPVVTGGLATALGDQ